MENNDILIQKLEKFIRKYYHNIAIRGSIVFTAILLALFLIISVFEYFAYSNSLLRTVLFYGFLSINLAVMVFLIIVPLIKKSGILKRLSYEEAAKIIGNHFPEIDDKLLNTIQLNRLIVDSQEVKSMELLLASIDFKIEQIKPFTFHKAINIGQNLKYIKYAAIPLLIILFIFLWNARVFTEPTHRIMHYTTQFEKPAPYRFIIENDALNAFQNEDFTLHIRLEGEEMPEDAYIEINDNPYKLERESNSKYFYVVKNVQKTIEFRFITDEVKTRYYELTVLPKPMMINFSIALEYPAYIHKTNETVDNNGDLNIPQGTKVSWKFNTRNTEEVILNFPDKRYILSKQSDIFTYSMRIMENINYTVFNKNKYITNKDSLHYFINVIPDLYPQIEVISMNDSVFIDRFYFKGNISDDYGFKKLNFVYAISNDKDSLSKNKQLNIPIDLSLNGQDFYYYFDAQSLQLSLGDKLIYYFEVWDNDGVNGSKSTRSLSMEYRLPSAEEIEKKSEEISNQTKSDLKALMKESEKILKDIEELKKKMIDKNQPGWEEKNKMEGLLKQLQNIKKEIENVTAQQEQQHQLNNQINPLDEELMRKQEELQKRFNDLFTDEMKQTMNEIQMLMQQNIDKNKFNDMLQKMELSTEELNKQLDRDLELFKQLEFEKKFESTLEKAFELAEKQQKLAEETATKDADSKQQMEKQQELQNEFQQMMEDIKALEKINKGLEDPYTIPDLKNMEAEIKQKMNEAVNQLQKNKKSNSTESQKQAGEKMQEMAEEMESSFQEEQSENIEEDMRAIRQILDNIIKVSFEQEDVMIRLSKTKPQDPALQQIIQEQLKMKDNLRMIEDSISAVARRQQQVSSYITKQIANINNAQKQILETIQMTQDIMPQYYRYAPNYNQAVSKQQYVMTGLNDLALMLAESLNKMKESQNNSSCETGSCKKNKGTKPGSSGSKSMKSLREMQEKLNQQLEELRQQMQNPGQKQGEGQKNQPGSQSISEQFARMAAQQEAIRRMMQDYQSQLKKEGKGYDGQLDKLMKEMEQTEKELVNKIINQQTMHRQQEIMTRLLESERAEIQREKEEKRESKTAQDVPPIPPSKLLDEKLKQKKEIELYKTIPPSLNYFYKNKVNNYFYNVK